MTKQFNTTSKDMSEPRAVATGSMLPVETEVLLLLTDKQVKMPEDPIGDLEMLLPIPQMPAAANSYYQLSTNRYHRSAISKRKRVSLHPESIQRLDDIPGFGRRDSAYTKYSSDLPMGNHPVPDSETDLVHRIPIDAVTLSFARDAR